MSIARLVRSTQGQFQRSVFGQRAWFHQSAAPFQDKKTSVFGDITSSDAEKSGFLPVNRMADMADQMGANQAPSGTELLSKEEQARKEMERVKANVTLESDAEYQKYVQKTFPPLVSETHFLSPLKRKVYLANVSKNGFFKNGETVAVGKDKYTLKLTRQEIEALEPGLYLKSYRIKSSTKKVTLVTRLVGGMPLLAAITQCQFGLKKVLRELAELLQRGVDKAPLLKLDPQDLYISQIWSGSDGKADKLMDIKGRGRLGVIRFRYAHVRVVLKTSQTKRRLAWEQQQKQAAKPAWDALASHKLRGVAPGHFGW